MSIDENYVLTGFVYTELNPPWKGQITHIYQCKSCGDKTNCIPQHDRECKRKWLIQLRTTWGSKIFELYKDMGFQKGKRDRLGHALQRCKCGHND